MSNSKDRIGAVVLAAGMSRRMGSPKMVLPWGETSVVGQVVSVLEASGIDLICVVVGGDEEAVRKSLDRIPVQIVSNPNYANGRMVESLQCGLHWLTDKVDAAFVVLGDQPQIEEAVVRSILSCYQETKSHLIVPSYQMHRGHPWLIGNPLFPDLFAFDSSKNLRTFLNAQAKTIHYIEVERSSILMDLDTPDEYQAVRPD